MKPSLKFTRQGMLDRLTLSEWDIIVIGGGATGLGAALDAAARGYQTLLLEKGDFAQETSSSSTNLIHGGVRYLRQLNFSLIYHCLQEREILLKNAPHLVHSIPFILPTANFAERMYYLAGIKLYELLGRDTGFQTAHGLSKNKTLIALPTIKPEHLNGSICYYDGQFDDARLAINLAQTIAEQGGTVINYMQVDSLLKSQGRTIGVQATDLRNGRSYELKSKVVINATGVFTDDIHAMDEPTSPSTITPSQGAHIVLDPSFFPGKSAMIIPKTKDDRVIFAIPWHYRVIIGTTETRVNKISSKPTPQKDEIDYLLEYAGKYLTRQPTESDILSSYAGLRPLIKPKIEKKSTAQISRDYTVSVSPSNLISVIGGKWGIYRKMGQDTIDVAIKTAQLPNVPCKTWELKIHGWCEPLEKPCEWDHYGADRLGIEQLAKDNPEWLEKLHPQLPCRTVDVIWAVRNEMAQTVEDVLSRRTRCTRLGERNSKSIEDKVASIMEKEVLNEPRCV